MNITINIYEAENRVEIETNCEDDDTQVVSAVGFDVTEYDDYEDE